jgi:hypothetical protein
VELLKLDRRNWRTGKTTPRDGAWSRAISGTSGSLALATDYGTIAAIQSTIG